MVIVMIEKKIKMRVGDEDRKSSIHKLRRTITENQKDKIQEEERCEDREKENDSWR